MKNKILSIIAVLIFPLVVISFAFKDDETNFILEESKNEEVIPNDKIEEQKDISIKVLVDGEIATLDFNEYIIGVVAGEMPASFDLEALKAQSVASRTYALYKKKSNASLEYDLTDNTNNQVYLTIQKMQKKWGEDYQKYYDKIKQAVMETKGEVIVYNGELIEAFYFAMSAGNTQESASVFKENRDYLQSVESIYDNEKLNNYEVSTVFNVNEFKNKLGLSCENLSIDNINRNETGYVNEISICSIVFEGTKFRNLLGIRSTNFNIDIKDVVTIITKGYGHGVGMSQYGANGYANHGYDYQDILKHYYTGVDIVDISSLK